jgi:hypothetical protein
MGNVCDTESSSGQVKYSVKGAAGGKVGMPSEKKQAAIWASTG